MYQWPKDNEAALIAFYGTPGPEALVRGLAALAHKPRRKIFRAGEKF
jgi:hypothetical protein